jgi:hypothetical protein
LNKLLITNVELLTAALSQAHVVVSKNNMLENAGIIREYCEDYVRIGDSWFARHIYGFHIITK